MKKIQLNKLIFINKNKIYNKRFYKLDNKKNK